MLTELCGPVAHVHEVPPGVDIELWRPEASETALVALLDEARRDVPNPGNAEERLPDDGNAARLASFLDGDLPTVVYFGKLIEQKGVHVLLEALAGIDARVVVVGFGPERAALEALAAGEGVRALFTGPLEHRHLRHLLALRGRVRRALRVPGGVRHGRRRGGGRGLPARRVAPLRAGGGRGGDRGGAAARARAARLVPDR